MKKINDLRLLVSLFVVVGIIGILLLSNMNNIKKKETVYFVSKSLEENRHFWSVLEDGAKVSANSHNIELIVVGPKRETQIEEQIRIMEDLVAKRPYGIMIAATDYELLGDVCDRAMDAGIIVVAVDSDVSTKSEHSIVATNNLKAANEIARVVCDELKECRYAMVSHVKGVTTNTDRAIGFKEEMERSGYDDFIGEYYSNNNMDTAIMAANEILDRGGVDVIYATNETNLQAVAQVVDERGLADDVMVVGFDTNEKIVSYLERGVIDYTMVQQPFNMGYLAMEEMVKRDKKEAKNIDTKAVMVDKDTLFDGANARLVFPIELEE